MLKFFLKKNFCDGWDNFFFLILSNVITVALIAGSYFAVLYSARLNPYLPYLVCALCCGVVMTALFAWGANAAKIADFCAGTFGTFFSALKSVWEIGLVSGILLALALFLLRFAAAYYLLLYFENGSLAGLVVSAGLGWFALVCVMALQWFIPLYFLQSDNGFMKCLKKSFIIFYDNVGFSIQIFFYNIVLLVLSVITLFLFPGLNGILLSSTNALRLRLYKYDWIEKMTESDPDFEKSRDKRADVPWEELIAEDKEALGPRKLGSFIFPWQ